ncbi:unnamed protein product [Parnassius mnemosyne]|uniref:Uncharacterized protein n=1 Tax=Parnassius mnemosyne TaxID=213953 RepID=A0AAV1KKT6_9NEOP
MTQKDMTKETNIRKGFEGSGIFPFNPSRVTLKIPTVQEENTRQFDASLLEFLQRNRRLQLMKTGKNSKLTVVPGKSISTEEAEELDTPECLQLKIVIDSKPYKNPNKNKKPNNYVQYNYKKASPENITVLRDIDTQMNKRKRRQASTSRRPSSKIKRRKDKKFVHHSDSSLTSETSFLAADDSDYESFDNYIASCLQEQEEQENICPFELSDINFYVEDYLGLQENSWIIVKFASKKVLNTL